MLVMSLSLSIFLTVVLMLSDRVFIRSLLRWKKSFGFLSLLIASTIAFFRRLSTLTQKMFWRLIMKLLMARITCCSSSGPSSGGGQVKLSRGGGQIKLSHGGVHVELSHGGVQVNFSHGDVQVRSSPGGVQVKLSHGAFQFKFSPGQ